MLRTVGFTAAVSALMTTTALSAPIINSTADRAAFESGQGGNIVSVFDFDGEAADRAFVPSEIPGLTFGSPDAGFNPRIDTFGGATPFFYDDPINNPGNVPSNRPVRIDLADDVDAIGFSWATDFDTRVDGGLSVEVVDNVGTVLSTFELGGASVDESFFPDDLPGGSGFDNFATITGLRDVSQDAVAIVLTPTGTGVDQVGDNDFVALDNIVISNFQEVPRTDVSIGPVLVGEEGSEIVQMTSGSGRVPNDFADDGDGQFDVGDGRGPFDTAGGPHDIELEFAPDIRTDGTAASGVLTVEDSDGNPIQHFDVSGTAVAPIASIEVDYSTAPSFGAPVDQQLTLGEDDYAEDDDDGPRNIIDLGFIRLGQEVDLQFLIENIGDGNLADVNAGDLRARLIGQQSNDVFVRNEGDSSFRLGDGTVGNTDGDATTETLGFQLNPTLSPFSLFGPKSTSMDILFENASPDGRNDSIWALFDIQATVIGGFFSLGGVGLETPATPTAKPQDGVINVKSEVEGFTLDDEQNFSLEVTNTVFGESPPPNQGLEDNLFDLFVQGMDGATEPDPLTLTILGADITGDDAENADVLGVSGYRILDETDELIDEVVFAGGPREEDILEGGVIELLADWTVVFDFAFNLSSDDFDSVVAGGLDLSLDLRTDVGASEVGLEGNTLSVNLNFSAIPGPAALALLLPGLAALLWRRRA